MEGIIQNQQSQLQATQQELLQSAQQRTQLEQQLREARSSSQSSQERPRARGPETKPLIDTRILGKPDGFNGEDHKWKDWSIVTKTYAGVVCPELAELMVDAEGSETAVHNATLLEEEQRAASHQLYFILLMLCRGPALDRVVNAGNLEGLEAWCQLTQR